ncbi:hypothetical protein FAM09_26530 [Niastella caeni]|uniref:Hyaluronidase n=1 Tax=Niastella caeni TaxID=2569763 RepID=A0A4S8HDQ9_9BACT|nr:hypothetical protein [Niastella caeni]THU33003.1 hypothetical protein FAM09_26530 [Niastella caeni]
MKVLQLAGHLIKWNLDAYYQNDISEGFVICAYNFENGYFSRDKISGYETSDILNKAYFDLQYFAKKDAKNITKGKLGTYPFHPAAAMDDGSQTNTWIENLIKQGVKFQIETLGLKNIIIPNYYENDNLEQFVGMIKTINRWLSNNKIEGVKYYMTIPITNHTIIDAEKIDKLLFYLTDISIVFDGYYILCESKPDNRQKVSTDFKYLNNLTTVLYVLKKQKFTTIYSYANWDALIFLSLTDIDYITIGTYENLRNFSIKRFTMDEDGGPSKGWYFSEKVLNFIKSPWLDLIRMNNGLDLIKNERNIFSDAILTFGYPWSNQKPEVHKNYLLSVERQLKEIASIEDLSVRKKYMIDKIDAAIATYRKLNEMNIYFDDESRNYHLATWRSYLLSKNILT